MKRITGITAGAAGLAAGLLGLTIVADPPAEEVSGHLIAAPTNTVLPEPEPEPYVDGDSVIHIPGPAAGPAEPACAELEAERTAGRAIGVPYIKVPIELLHCDPHTFR